MINSLQETILPSVRSTTRTYQMYIPQYGRNVVCPWVVRKGLAKGYLCPSSITFRYVRKRRKRRKGRKRGKRRKEEECNGVRE